MRRYLLLIAVIFTGGFVSGCTTPELVKTALLELNEPEPTPHYKVGKPYKVGDRWYAPSYEEKYREIGMASWYGSDFHGNKTANGEIFDKDKMTAAHRTLPLPSVIKVTNLSNGRTATVRVNDRGPFAQGRVLDLSEAAAKKLGMHQRGTAKVKIELDNKATAEILKNEGYTKIASKYAAKPKKFVQAGSYSAFKSAQKQTVSLHKIAPVKIEKVQVAKKDLYKVKLGPFADATQAMKTLNQAKKMGYSDAILVND